MISNSKFLPLFPPHKLSNTVPLELQEELVPIVKLIPSASETYDHVLEFLREHYRAPSVYDSYRSEIVVFINYIWANGIDVMDVDRKVMLDFLHFCENPPSELISSYRHPAYRVDKKTGEVSLNYDWRPFCNTNPQSAYQRAENSTQKQLSVLSALYIFLEDIQYLKGNPPSVIMRRYKKSIDFGVQTKKYKSLSKMQVLTLFQVLDELCEECEEADRLKWERSRMLANLMFLAFPRRSEVSANVFYSPVMSDFKRERVGDSFLWVFCIRKAKGNKYREVICSKALIDALTRYRRFLGLSDLPKPDENEPLFRRLRPAGHGREAGIVDANIGSGQVANLMKDLFERSAQALDQMEEWEEANSLRKLSTHSTRHTGISLALASGRKPELLMHCTGHSTISSLMIYNSDRLDFRIGEVELIDNMLKFD
ncbi:site-specific integrase [Vibrio parahaemolyticus]